MTINYDTFRDLTIPIMHKGEKIDQKLLWIKSDVGCLPIILSDWNANIETFLKYTPGRKAMIQAGGNCGLYPLLFSTFFDTVYTFEPEPLNYYCLSHNCGERIVKFNAALSNKCGFLNMQRCLENVGMSRIMDQGFPVYAMTLDSIEYPHIDLIQLDLETFELPALKAAKKTIKKHKPTVVVEYAENTKQIDAYFDKIDYVKVHVSTNKINNIVTSSDAVFVHKDKLEAGL